MGRQLLFIALSLHLKDGVFPRRVSPLADRSDSHSFAKRFDDSYHKMQSYVKILENEIAERGKLIGLLENGQTFYEVQNGDAMVVANVSQILGIVSDECNSNFAIVALLS